MISLNKGYCLFPGGCSPDGNLVQSEEGFMVCLSLFVNLDLVDTFFIVVDRTFSESCFIIIGKGFWRHRPWSCFNENGEMWFVCNGVQGRTHFTQGGHRA